MPTLSSGEDFAEEHFVEVIQPPTVSQVHLDFGVVVQGSCKTLQEVISNSGRQPMIWLADTGGREWLSVEPDSGVLQAGEQQMVGVRIDTRRLAIGEYTFSLRFTSEGDEVSMGIDVTGEVALATHTMGFDFGSLLPESSKVLNVTVNVPELQSGVAGQWKAEIIYPVGQPRDWLTLERTSGPLHNGPQIISAIANARGLKLQDQKDVPHMATVHFTAEAGGRMLAQTQIPFSLYISNIPFHNGGPKIPDPPPSARLVRPAHGGVVNATLAITNPTLLGDVTNSDVEWELTSPVSWIVIPVKKGKLLEGQTIQVQVQIPGNVNLPKANVPYKADLPLSFTYDPLRQAPQWTNTTTTHAHIELTVQ